MTNYEKRDQNKADKTKQSHKYTCPLQKTKIHVAKSEENNKSYGYPYKLVTKVRASLRKRIHRYQTSQKYRYNSTKKYPVYGENLSSDHYCAGAMSGIISIFAGPSVQIDEATFEYIPERSFVVDASKN